SQVVVRLLQCAALKILVAGIKLCIGLFKEQGPPVPRGRANVKLPVLLQWDLVVNLHLHPLPATEKLECVTPVTSNVLGDEAVLDYAGETHQSGQGCEHEAFVVIALSELLTGKLRWKERLADAVWVQFGNANPPVGDMLVFSMKTVSWNTLSLSGASALTATDISARDTYLESTKTKQNK
ncbi:hypothetical protein TcG_05036, partial [Trypanosoma cruzi]